MDYPFETIVHYSQLIVFQGVAIPKGARASYRAAL